MGQAFPLVQRAIELGGDAARQIVSENEAGNFIYQYIAQDAALQQLLGPQYLPADNIVPATAVPSSATSEAVDPVQSATDAPVQPETPEQDRAGCSLSAGAAGNT